MPDLIDDLVVVLPGIMGTTLHHVDPSSGDHTPLWEPSEGLITAIRGINRATKVLALPEGIGDDHPDDNIVPQALIPDVQMPLGLWTFNIGYTAMIDALKQRLHLQDDPALGPVNLIVFPYDWRLSNRYNGARLGSVVEPALEQWRAQGGRFADAQVQFVCHSMGGLVARWYVDHLGGAEITRGIVTLGTPHRGAPKAIKQLVNGIQIGPKLFGLNLTDLARSLPSIFQLLPSYACVTSDNGLQNLREVPLPELDGSMVDDAMTFHEQLAAGRTETANHYALRPIVGFKQRTATTIELKGDKAIALDTINGEDERGDATVPRLSATPSDVSPSEGLTIADNHGGIIHNTAAFDLIEGYLTARKIVHRSYTDDLAVDAPETLSATDTLVVTCETESPRPVEVVITDRAGEVVDQQRLVRAGADLTASLPIDDPGVYNVTVQGATPAARTQVAAISSLLTVWPSDEDLDLDEGC